MSWAAKGVWPPCSKAGEVNVCARTRAGKLIASGDIYSKIKLFRYPAY
jgi:hypothetical protein